MDEKEVMNLLNSIDDDLVDEKIDNLLNKKGESVNMSSIKEKALNKLNENEMKKKRIGKKPFVAAAIAATLTISTVYASEISNAIKSLFANKSILYSSVVDGDAYYLPEEIKLNDKFTLTNISVSKGRLDMYLKSNMEFLDDKVSGLDIAIIPLNNKDVCYKPGGYGLSENGYSFNFYNETENNYNIEPFKDFKFMLDGETYNVSLTKAENVAVDDSLVIGKSENNDIDNDVATEDVQPLIANVAGSTKVKDGVTNIQLVTHFDNPDLKLYALGELDFTEFNRRFENKNGILSSGNSTLTKPILAYDKNNNPYTLEIPQNALGRPITTFETNAKPGTDLTVKLPSIVAGYEKEVEKLSFSIPKEGEAVINKELDFIIQKANVKSIKRTSEDTAVVEFELNTGADKRVFLNDIGAYSKDVIKAETIIKGNTATMTMTFDKDTKEASFRFSWPRYVIQGNWSIELGESK